MTIDEAIKKMEDLSEKQYKLSEISLHEHAKEANYKNAEDSRQIANWLRELKAYRSMWDKVIEEINENKKTCLFFGDMERKYGLNDAKKIIEKYKKEIADKESD